VAQTTFDLSFSVCVIVTTMVVYSTQALNYVGLIVELQFNLLNLTHRWFQFNVL